MIGDSIIFMRVAQEIGMPATQQISDIQDLRSSLSTPPRSY